MGCWRDVECQRDKRRRVPNTDKCWAAHEPQAVLPALPFPHLVLNLLGRVGHHDGRGSGSGRGGHLGLGATQGGEELGVDQRRLAEAETRRDVARHAEVGVLVDGLHAW